MTTETLPISMEVKMEQSDDVIAGIMKGGESDDEEMTDNRPSIPTSPVSPVSPAPITSPTSPTNNFLKTEPITPPQETEDNNQRSDGNDEGNDPATPLAEKTRILKLSGDSGRKSRNRIEPDEDKDSGISTIEDFTKRPNARNVRFFVIKSFSERHLQISVDKGIWATQRHNENKLNDAYKKSDVVLVFSVNESRHFQGYAQMISRIGGQRPANNVWTDSKDEGVWGSSFEVKWLQLHNLPFTETLHLRNPMNEDKPVKISRDGTELAIDTAMALCSLIDKGAAKSDKKRKPFGESGDGVGESKRNRNFEAPPRAHEFLPLPPPTSRRVVLPPHTPLPHPSMFPFNPRNGYSHAPSGGHLSSSRHSDRHSTNYHSNINNNNNNNNNYSNQHSNHHSNYNNFHPPHHFNNNNNNGPAYSRGPFSSSSSSSFVPSSSRNFPSSSFNERYAPRHDSPPSKRIRSRSHSPPPFHPHPPPFHSLKMSGGFHNHPYHGDRKRKDREDDNDRRDRGRGRDDRDLDHKDRERGRDREYERDRERGERGERADRGDRGDRDRERDIERDKERERDRTRDRDRRDSRDKIRSSNDSSPPPDLLNMSYEDYLRALAKYRRLPSAVPGGGGGGVGGAGGGAATIGGQGWGLGGNAISERDYRQYMDMISKLGSAASLFPFSDNRGIPP